MAGTFTYHADYEHAGVKSSDPDRSRAFSEYLAENKVKSSDDLEAKVKREFKAAQAAILIAVIRACVTIIPPLNDTASVSVSEEPPVKWWQFWKWKFWRRLLRRK